MKKTDVINFFSELYPHRGPLAITAEIVQVSLQSVFAWPDVLPKSTEARVLAAQARLQGMVPLQKGRFRQTSRSSK